MNQKTKYLTTFTYGRGSKWYMGYGSVLLRLGGVRSQRRNGYKNMIVEISELWRDLVNFGEIW